MIALARVDATCPGNPEGAHVWGWHDTGRGCLFCPAWVAYPDRADEHVDPHPTAFPAFHIDTPIYVRSRTHPESYRAAVADDDALVIDIMDELLPVNAAGQTLSFGQLRQVAERVISRVSEQASAR